MFHDCLFFLVFRIVSFSNKGGIYLQPHTFIPVPTHVHLSTHLSIHLSIYLPTLTYIFTFTYLPTNTSFSQSDSQSINLLTYLYSHIPTYARSILSGFHKILLSSINHLSQRCFPAFRTRPSIRSLKTFRGKIS